MSSRVAPPVLAVLALTLLGGMLRLRVAHEALFADELSTYWIVVGNDLGTVLSTVQSNNELTPPLFCVGSWLATRFGSSPELVRFPSLVAGIAMIPLVYQLGLRLAGPAVGLTAAAITTFAPFMIYYAAEARAYALMMCMVTLSTLAMVIAVDTRRTRWWVVYAVATAGAVYSHYTCVFLLAAQALWLVVAYPEARWAGIAASFGAALLYVPWLPGFLDDIRSPTTVIAYQMQPFTPADVVKTIKHWTIGYPYSFLGLDDVPGPVGLALLGLAGSLMLVGVAMRMWRGGARGLDRRGVLIVVLALSVPIGGAVASFGGKHVFSTRNLAASWPGLALLSALLLHAAGGRLGVVAATLAVAGLAIGGVRMLDPQHQRPDYQAAAAMVDREARDGDVVVEQTAVLSPAPVSSMVPAWRRTHRVFSAGLLQPNTGPLGPRSRFAEVLRSALDAAKGGRIFLVQTQYREIPSQLLAALVTGPPIPPPYRLVERRSFPGFLENSVEVYEAPAAAAR